MSLESDHYAPEAYVIPDGEEVFDLGLIEVLPLIDQRFASVVTLNDREDRLQGILVESMIQGEVISRSETDVEGHFTILLPRADHTLKVSLWATRVNSWRCAQKVNADDLAPRSERSL